MQNRLPALALAAALLLWAPLPAAAQESQPGDACTAGELHHMRQSSGPESPGTGYSLVCDGANWRLITEWDTATGSSLFQVDYDPGACDALKLARLRFNSAGDLWEYCDGADWTDLASGGGLWSDSGAGYIEYSSALGGMLIAGVTGQPAPNIIGVTNLTDLGDVNASSPADQQVLKYDNGTGKWIPGTAGGTPAGADTQLQFNSGGAFGASANFVFTTDGDLLLTGVHTGTASAPASGSGGRMFFDSQAAAFRAGYVTGTQWNTANVGDRSIGLGHDAQASSSYSIAIGQGVTSSGWAALALGREASVSGNYAAVIGLGANGGTIPLVSGQSSFGIFMGDQSGKTLTATNTMGLFGGKMVIDPRVPATNLSADAALEVAGGIKLDFDSDACTVTKEGTLRFNSAGAALELCDGAAWAAVGGGVPGGANGEVQFNSNGSFLGHSGFTYDGAGALTLSGSQPTTLSATTDSTTSPASAVYGRAFGATGIGYGGYFQNSRTVNLSAGVYGWSTGSTGNVRGVHGRSSSSTGTGVFGEASHATGPNYGVFGSTVSTQGTGVRGYASATTGTTYGGRFSTQSSSGIGLLAFSEDPGSKALVVQGDASQTANLAEFQNDSGTALTVFSSAGYLGIGLTDPETALDIAGTMRAIDDAAGCTGTERGAIRFNSAGAALELCDGAAWGGVGGGASALNDLSDAIYDGSSLFLGTGAGVNDDANNANVALGFDALNANTSGEWNTAVGYQALKWNTTGDGNAAVGLNALVLNTTGTWNVALGYNALNGNTVGDGNTGIGMDALQNNKAKSRSTAIGFEAMRYADDTATASFAYNTAVGYQTLRGSTTAANNTGTYNTAVGSQAMYNNTSGYQNVAIGSNALLSNTTGWANVALGKSALENNTTADKNTAIGTEALQFNTTGDFNTAVGRYTLINNTTGIENTAVGQAAGGDFAAADGDMDGNSLFGHMAGYKLAGGASGAGANYNTLIGNRAGDLITTGDDNIMIGRDTDPTSATASNELNIGNTIYADLSTDFVGIGTDSPDAALDVVGDIHFTGLIVDVSDIRLKHNIRPLQSPLQKLVSLQGFTFEMKDDPRNTVEYGVSAQEVKKVFPELVREVDNKGTLGVSYNGLMAPVIESIKALKEENDRLRMDNDDLRARLEVLERKTNQYIMEQ